MKAYVAITPGILDEQIEATLNQHHAEGYDLVTATALSTGATRLYFKLRTAAPPQPPVNNPQQQQRRRTNMT